MGVSARAKRVEPPRPVDAGEAFTHFSLRRVKDSGWELVVWEGGAPSGKPIHRSVDLYMPVLHKLNHLVTKLREDEL